MGLFGAFSAKPTKDAVATAAKAIQTGQIQGKDQLDQGYDQAADLYGQAGGLFGNLTSGYKKGSDLYADAMGVNGSEGSDRARSAYTTGAGYGFNMDQGLQALQRARAVNGTLASGNADTDAMKFASGLASQDWNSWLQGLSGYDAKTMAATTGQAGTLGALGNLAYQTGAGKAGIDVNAGNAVAQGAYKVGEAETKANEAKLGALLGVANLAGSAFGGLAGNGSAIGNIGKNLSSLGSGVKSAFSIFG